MCKECRDKFDILVQKLAITPYETRLIGLCNSSGFKSRIDKTDFGNDLQIWVNPDGYDFEEIKVAYGESRNIDRVLARIQARKNTLLNP
jgi:hypothetical protein